MSAGYIHWSESYKVTKAIEMAKFVADIYQRTPYNPTKPDDRKQNAKKIVEILARYAKIVSARTDVPTDRDEKAHMEQMVSKMDKDLSPRGFNLSNDVEMPNVSLQELDQNIMRILDAAGPDDNMKFAELSLYLSRAHKNAWDDLHKRPTTLQEIQEYQQLAETSKQAPQTGFLPGFLQKKTPPTPTAVSALDNTPNPQASATNTTGRKPIKLGDFNEPVPGAESKNTRGRKKGG